MATRQPHGRVDFVALIETIYAPEPDWQRWGAAVLDETRRFIGGSPYMYMAVLGHGDELEQLGLTHLVVDPALAPFAAVAPQIYAAMDRKTAAAIWYPGRTVAMQSELLPQFRPEQVEMLLRLRPPGRDGLGALAYPQSGVAVALAALLEDTQAAPSSQERRVLSRIVAHLDGGVRLRMRPDLAVAAVLRSDGRLVDAASDDVAKQREHLADQVRAVELARKSAVRTTPAAVAHWRALVDGEYTVVPRSDERGGSTRREYHFLRNGPLARANARLSPREVAVLRQVARGHSQGDTAYALGIADTTVSLALERARQRLGLESRAVLVRAARACFGYRGQTIDRSTLTPAEREVLSLLQEGLQNADIARTRGTSPNTVANQVAAILRKTDAKSRRDLALLPERASNEE